MLFLDFLTLCTEPGIYFCWSFLFFSVVERLTRPAPCCPLCPAGVPLPPPAHLDGLHTTGSAPTHTPGRWTRCTGLHPIPDRPRGADRDGAGGWRVRNPSITCIMIALSQAWYIDSILYKYHTNILLYLVIANYYLSIDIPPY